VLGGQLVVFGGYGAQGPCADTWTFDGTTWTAASTTNAPSARYGAVMAPLGNTLVLFGGEDASGTYLSDTWTWDGSTWTSHAVAGPTSRAQASIATVDGAVILFGGYGLQTTTSEGDTTLSDTWSWDGSMWTNLSIAGPSARTAALMAAFVPG
jgi:N-acetylneuraminic acid mutarotase